MTTYGCAASSAQQCHKRCGAGLYWNAEDVMCKKCPPGTYWPATTGLETDTCIPCANPKGRVKNGAKFCPAYPNKPAKNPLGA